MAVIDDLLNRLVSGEKIVPFRNADLSALSTDDTRRICFFNAHHIIDAGRVNEYRFLAVRHDKRLMIRCGCRWFTVKQAKKHWRYRFDRKEARAALKFVVAVAEARGWKIGR